MIVIVLRHELRRVSRDRAILVLLLLFAALAAFAGINGASWVEDRKAAIGVTVEDADKQMREQLERAMNAQKSDGLLRPVAFPYTVRLDPLPLSSLSIGQAESYPFAASILPLMSRHMIFDRYGVGTESARVLAAGRFDLAFLLVFLLPIFILAATYDLWTEERDRGTAGLVLAQPVRTVPLLAAKALAHGGAVLLPALLMTIITLVTLASPDLAGVLALSGMILIYGLFWIALAVAINIFARRASEAAVAAGAAWLILVVLAPALASAMVDIVLPPASRAELINAVRRSKLEAEEAGGTISLAGKHTMHQMTPLEREARFSGGRLAEVREGEGKVEPLSQEVAERDVRRIRVTQALRLAFPSVAMQNALDTIAGTDAGRAVSFQTGVGAFLDKTRAFFDKFIAEKRLMKISDIPDIPKFTPDGRSLRPLAIDAAAVLAATTFLMILAAVGIRQRRLLEG